MTPIEIISRRLALGLSRHAAAKVWGVKHDTWVMWEDGRRRIPPGIGDDLARAETVVQGWAEDAAAAILRLVDGGETDIIVSVHNSNIVLDSPHAGGDGARAGIPWVFHAVAMARARAAVAERVDIQVQLEPADPAETGTVFVRPR